MKNILICVCMLLLVSVVCEAEDIFTGNTSTVIEKEGRSLKYLTGTSTGILYNNYTYPQKSTAKDTKEDSKKKPTYLLVTRYWNAESIYIPCEINGDNARNFWTSQLCTESTGKGTWTYKCNTFDTIKEVKDALKTEIEENVVALYDLRKIKPMTLYQDTINHIVPKHEKTVEIDEEKWTDHNWRVE